VGARHHAGKQYPPVEFDHPYPGKVVLIEGASQEALHVLCPLPGAILGCAVPKRDGVSTIAIADEKQSARGDGRAR
jgi:hypothetical protein